MREKGKGGAIGALVPGVLQVSSLETNTVRVLATTPVKTVEALLLRVIKID